jgi:S1-C subfamily serine protease
VSRPARSFVVGVVVVVAGCGGRETSARAPAAEVLATDAPTCRALGPLLDLGRAMTTSPTDRSAPLHALVDAQEELAYARIAEEGLAGADASSPLRVSVSRLVEALGARTAALADAASAAAESYRPVERAVGEAAFCWGLGFRAAKRTAEERTLLRSRACAGTARVWAATRMLDARSPTSTSAVAAQLAELAVGEQEKGPRDRLSAALTAHASRLRVLAKAAEHEGKMNAAPGLGSQRAELGERIRAALRGCVVSRPDVAGTREGAADPRSATVMVRPTWSGPLRSLPGASEPRFGSGFLVRWRRSDGQPEVLVVTNRHVMEGSVEAEILLAAELDARGRQDEPLRRTARLVASDANDDVAVLRVEGAAAAALEGGVAFRLHPPREQEVVVAAGFPGVGMLPSYQVTRGVISNAHFGTEERDVGLAYLQHTAPIDPGNSGGPLLDDDGRLLGMNTAKLSGRDNVSLAIPAARIRLALSRAEQARTFDELHAQASCNIALEALSAEHPTVTSIERFGLSLFERRAREAPPTKVVHRDPYRVVGVIDGPLADARLRGYEMIRAELEADEGVAPYETCTDVARGASGGAAAGFTATFRAHSGALYRATLGEENGLVRVTGVDRLP